MKKLIRELTPFYINEFSIIYKKNDVVISNFKSIRDFNNDKIIIKTEDKDVIIRGKNMCFNKLLSSEVRIIGDIENIEFR